MRKIFCLCVVVLCVISGCNSKRNNFITDLTKDCLKGKVRSVTLYAGNYEKSAKGFLYKGQPVNLTDSTRHEPFEIIIMKTSYTHKGFYSEIERIRKDSIVVLSDRKFKNKAELKSYKHDSIYQSVYSHEKYGYEGNKLKYLILFNLSGDCTRMDKYYFKRKKIIDSAFYMNGGFLSVNQYKISKFGLDTPRWARPGSKFQYDKDRNILIENKIHYYYLEYDKSGNWTKAIKYFDGPNKDKPVYLRREINYYK